MTKEKTKDLNAAHDHYWKSEELLQEVERHMKLAKDALNEIYNFSGPRQLRAMHVYEVTSNLLTEVQRMIEMVQEELDKEQ